MGGKTATSSSKVTIPPEVLARYNETYGMAKTAATKPFQAFGNAPSDYVAQMNEQQQAGISDINATAGSYKPYMGAAAGATMGVMGPSYEGIGNYMSPYIQNVADTTGAMMRQANEQAQSGALGAAAASGAFGGDRAGVAAANLNQQNQMAYGKTMADIYNQGYGQAMGAHQADLARQMQGGQQLAGLGAQSQALGLQGAQAKIAAGTMQQQTEQAGKDAMIQRFMQEQGYPFQTAQYLANIAMGTGALSGTTTTSRQPTGMFGFFRDGGSVGAYAKGGGVSGPMSVSQQDIGGEGYVPGGILPVGQLMIAEAPQQQQGNSSTDTMLKLAQMIPGMASGGVAGGRHGYAIDGAVTDPYGSPPASSAWTPDDEAKHKAAMAAADAALGAAKQPTAFREYNVGQDVYHKVPTGTIYDASNRPVDLSQAEQVRNEIARQDRLTEQARLTGLDDLTARFHQHQADVAQRNKDALVGMYGMDQGSQPTQILDRPIDLGSMPSGYAGRPDAPMGLLPAAQPQSMVRPEGVAAGMPPSPMASSPRPQPRPEGLGVAPLVHPVHPMADFWAKMGASDSAIANATQHPSGVAGATMVDAKGNPVPSVTTVDQRLAQNGTPTGVAGLDTHTLFTSGIIPIESGGHQFRNGQPLTSPAGAIGIAQIMPGTGPEAARLAGLPWDENRFKTDAAYNAALGEAYFAQQRKTFGDPLMAAAAYNAGPGAVASAIDRATAHGGSYLDYLPAETQNYVRNFAARTGGTMPTGAGGLGGNADTSGGLGGARRQQQPGDFLHSNKPYEQRNMIGKFFHNQDGTLNQNAIMALLSGIGHMAEAHTVSPLGALLSGIGAGSDTYKGLQKQAADIGLINAQAERQGILTPGETGGPALDISGNQVRPLLGEIGPDGVTMPYQAPKGVESIVSSPDFAKGLQLDGPMVMASSSPQAAASVENFNNVQTNYTSAKGTFTPIMSSFGAASSLIANGGVTGSGPAADTRAKVIAAANMILSSIPGIGPVSFDDMADNKAIIDKTSAIAAANGQGSSPSVEALRNSLTAQGDANLPPKALASITAQNLVDRQMAIDKGDFYRTWQQSQGLKTQMGQSTYVGAEGTFNDMMGQKYNAEKAYLEYIMLAPDNVPERLKLRDHLIHLSSGGAGPGYTPEAVQAAIKEAYPGAPDDLWKVFFNKGLAE